MEKIHISFLFLRPTNICVTPVSPRLLGLYACCISYTNIRVLTAWCQNSETIPNFCEVEGSEERSRWQRERKIHLAIHIQSLNFLKAFHFWKVFFSQSERHSDSFISTFVCQLNWNAKYILLLPKLYVLSSEIYFSPLFSFLLNNNKYCSYWSWRHQEK